MRYLTLLCWLFLVHGAWADGFQVGGAVARPALWTADQVRHALGSQAKTVYYRYRGADHSAACVSLWNVLQAAGLKTGGHNDVLRGHVDVEGADGYKVSFSLGELSPEFGNEAVFVGLDEDGAPLPADLGPARLVLPGDVKLGRWVHNIVRITVVAP